MKFKSIVFIILLTLVGFSQADAQSEKNKVPQAKMQEIYEQVKTPYKYGLVIVPDDNSKKADCPTVFRKGDKWLMTYLTFNGKWL